MMFLQLPIHRETAPLTIQKGMFFSPNLDYIYFSDIMIRFSESVKIPEIRVKYSLKLFPDTNFKTEILDMCRNFRTYSNPSLLGKLS